MCWVDAFSKYLQSRQAYGVIMADLDHFKQINDQAGPTERAIWSCANAPRRMSSAIRKSDAIGRYGGEEFVFVIDCENTAILKAAVERLRSAIADQPFELSGGPRSCHGELGGCLGSPRRDLGGGADRFSR